MGMCVMLDEFVSCMDFISEDVRETMVGVSEGWVVGSYRMVKSSDACWGSGMDPRSTRAEAVVARLYA